MAPQGLYVPGAPSFGVKSALWTLGGAKPPTWARVQGALNTTANGTTATLAFPAPITNGNIVVGAIMLINYQLPTSITDDKGNAYAFINSGYLAGGLNNTVTGFRSLGPITNGAKTLTFTYPTSTTTWLMMDEFNPGITLSGISVDGSQLLVARTAAATPNFQSLNSNCLQYFASFGTAAQGAGAGWTAAQGSGSQQFAEWRQAASPSATNSAVFTNAGQTWATAFGIAPVARTSWELRQNQIARAANNATTGSVSFPNTVASGSIVIGSIAVGTGGTNVTNITGITDDKGNSYSIVPNYINALGRAVFWSNGPVTNGPKTITCTTSATATVIYFLVNEFLPPPGTNTFAIDGTPTMVAPGAAPFTAGSITTTQNGDLLYGFTDLFGANALPANGFSTLNGQGMTWCDAFLIQQTAGAVAAQWTGGAGAANAIGLVAISATTNTSFNVPGLPKWSAAVQAVQAGTRNAKVLMIGDSTTVGYNPSAGGDGSNNKAASAPDVLAGLIPGGLGSTLSMVGTHNLVSNSMLAYDSHFGGGDGNWHVSSTVGGELLGGFALETNTTAAAAITYAPGVAWDTAEFYTCNLNTADTIATFYGATALSTIPMSGAVSLRKTTATKPLGSEAMSFTLGAGTGADYGGHILYNSAIKKIHVLNAGWNGATTTNLVENTISWGTVGAIPIWQPDLVILDIGINDYNVASPTAQATFKANIQQVINAATAANADVLLVVPVPIGTANGLANQAAYQTYIHDLATTNGLNTVDFQSLWGSFATANANGWMNTDQVHPTAAGYAQKAQGLFSAIWH